MKNPTWIFAFPLLLVVGCRTYVGSDDVYKTAPPEVLKKETGLKLKRGVILEIKDGRYVLTLAERSVTEQREKKKKYYCGRKYYYLDKEIDQPEVKVVIDGRERKSSGAKTALVTFPWMLLQGFMFSWGFDWKRKGEHAPGIGYCIAYLPIVHLFCAPFLLPPYSYFKINHLVDFDDTQPEKLVEETTYVRRIPAFALDTSQRVISIACGGETVKRTLSVGGKLEFTIADFPCATIENGVVEFTIRHPTWNKLWRIRSSSVIESAALRDWNILADAKYDYRTRFGALMRLEPTLSEKRCREYLRLLLAGELNIRTIVSAKSTVSGNQLLFGPRVRKTYPGMVEYLLGLRYENADKVLAVKMFRKGAEQGNARAQLKLGMCYSSGAGVEKNLAEADKWFRKAAEQGDEDVREALRKFKHNVREHFKNGKIADPSADSVH